MRIVRDREDARWLPSRFHFALFRLAALIRMSATPPRERRGIILAIDDNQSAIEHYPIAIWFLATASCFFAALMPLPAAIVVASVVVQTPIYLVARGQRVNSMVMMSLMTVAALFLTRSPTWIRFAAWQFLALLALNAVAALIMLALGGAVRKMEARCGL